MFDCMREFLVGNRSLTRDIWASERPSKLIWWRLHIHMSCFAFHGFPCSPSPASSDRLGHLAFKRRPSFAKLYQNFRGKSPYIKFILKKPMYVPVISYYFRETFAKKKYFSKQIEVLAFANSLWQYQRSSHTTQSRQGPLDRRSVSKLVYNLFSGLTTYLYRG